MTDLPRDELLSAYLDAELSAEERARAERLLAEDATARQRLEELRAVSEAVRGLPTEELGEDLSERILQLAERQMLSGRQAAPGEPPVVPGRVTWQAIGRRLLNRRALAWSSAVVVVALLIAVFDEPRVERDHPADEVARADKSAEPAVVAGREAKREKAVPELWAADEVARPARPAATPESEDRAAGEPAMAEPAVVEKRSVPTADAPRYKVAPATVPSTPSSSLPPVAIEPAPAPESAPAPALAPTSGYAAEDRPAKGADSLDAGGLGMGGMGGMGMGGASKAGMGLQEKAGPHALKRPSESLPSRLATRDGVVEDLGQTTAVAPILVVEVDVKPGPELRERFEKILVRNRIDLEEAPADPRESVAGERENLNLIEQQTARTEQTHDAVAKKSPAGRKPEAQPGDVEQVLVEATWDQLDATIEELVRQDDLVVRVSTQSPPAQQAQVPAHFWRFNWEGSQRQSTTLGLGTENRTTLEGAHAKAEGRTTAALPPRGWARWYRGFQGQEGQAGRSAAGQPASPTWDPYNRQEQPSLSGTIPAPPPTGLAPTAPTAQVGPAQVAPQTAAGVPPTDQSVQQGEAQQRATAGAQVAETPDARRQHQALFQFNYVAPAAASRANEAPAGAPAEPAKP